MKGKNYRVDSGQPYTRNKYIHGAPSPKISKFIMGDSKKKFSYKISMMSLNAVQITHNALEAARIAANKILSDVLGEKEYLMHIRIYPHNVLRENKMIATAGADRLQEGMRRAFGKPIGRAARIKENQTIIDVYVNEKQGLKVARKALETSAKKLPTSCKIVFENLDN